MARKDAIILPEVNFSEEGPIRHLHLGSEWIQGSMLVDAPNVLVHEYIQRMMAWLLFIDPATVNQRQAVQLGLGAGSLTKFCHKVLRMKNTTAIELNPQVLHACRGWFHLPADNPRMQVVLADASEEIKKPRWLGCVDALQVDLYDEEAAAPVLDSAAFYADCRAMLTDEGCMTVNLFGRVSSFQGSVDKIAEAFGRDAVWAFKSTREGNTVVMAQRTASRPKRSVVEPRAEYISTNWGLPADKWMRVFKPVVP
ncbi:spermidine synthase [Rhodoferax sp. GW822-FHT02A01]|uniref:spermidine synthase n=1 Tax=Rhodoferax sp. GW822-FHT02A01 TaxID=3141537 RepID=UPI00315CB3D6